MAYLILDEDVSAGFESAAGGWNTSVVNGGGGTQWASQLWALPRRQFRWSKINFSQDEMRVIMEMVDDCRGRAYPFLFRDELNHKLEEEVLLTATGGETTVQIKQTWGTNNLLSLDRKYLKSGTLDGLRLNGSELTISTDYTVSATGLITLLAPVLPIVGGDIISLDYVEFYHKVRFDQDLYHPTIDSHGVATLRSVSVTEDLGPDA